MTSLEAKIEALEKEAAQARQEGDKVLYRSLASRLALLQEEKVLLMREGVWVCP
jgi:hypothetical protein